MPETNEMRKLKENIEAASGLSFVTGVVLVFVLVITWMGPPNLFRETGIRWLIIILGAGLIMSLIRLARLRSQLRKDSANAEITAQSEGEQDNGNAPTKVTNPLWQKIGIIVCIIIYGEGAYMGIFHPREPREIYYGFIYVILLVILWGVASFKIWRKSKVPALIYLVAMAVLCGAVVQYKLADVFAKTIGTPDLAAIGELSGLRFPSGTRVIHSFSDAFMNQSKCIAILELGPGETNTFLNNAKQDIMGHGSADFSNIVRPFPEDSKDIQEFPSLDWWDGGGSMNKGIWVEMSYDDTSVRLLVSRDNPARPRVYLVTKRDPQLTVPWHIKPAEWFAHGAKQAGSKTLHSTRLGTLRTLRFTSSCILAKESDAGRLTVRELLGTSTVAAPGEVYAVRCAYKFQGLDAAAFTFACDGESREGEISAGPSAGELITTIRILKVNPGKGRQLHITAVKSGSDSVAHVFVREHDEYFKESASKYGDVPPVYLTIDGWAEEEASVAELPK